MIKALAHHTGRSIVNVPLSKISTNAELMSQLFDKKYQVPGEMPVNLDFKDVIFCLEDIDAASNIVKRRDGKPGGDNDVICSDEDILTDFPPIKSLWHIFLESPNDTCQELVKLLIQESERLRQAAQDANQALTIAESLADVRSGLALAASGNAALRKLGEETIKAVNFEDSCTEPIDKCLEKHASKLKRMLNNGVKVDDALVESLLSDDAVRLPVVSKRSPPAPRNNSDNTESDSSFSFEAFSIGPSSEGSDNDKLKTRKKKIASSCWIRPADALNLQGVLNALDGVVDCPGRIVIMTSNHPEKLDKALIRPGRIDKKIFMGKMQALDVMEMSEHYFQVQLSDDQKLRVEKAVTDGGVDFSPAQMEQLTVEHDSIEDMLAALEKMAPIRRFLHKQYTIKDRIHRR